MRRRRENGRRDSWCSSFSSDSVDAGHLGSCCHSAYGSTLSATRPHRTSSTRRWLSMKGAKGGRNCFLFGSSVSESVPQFQAKVQPLSPEVGPVEVERRPGRPHKRAGPRSYEKLRH